MEAAAKDISAYVGTVDIDGDERMERVEKARPTINDR
jgi:hypothetical protein